MEKEQGQKEPRYSSIRVIANNFIKEDPVARVLLELILELQNLSMPTSTPLYICIDVAKNLLRNDYGITLTKIEGGGTEVSYKSLSSNGEDATPSK